MAYRRSKDSLKAERNWSAFVTSNTRAIEAAGLPEIVTESIAHWDDFLSHGFIDHHYDPSRFTVDQLSNEQYAALVQLVESYFASGYEYFTPSVLRDEDLQPLEMRFRTP
jgi:hypothetical protein